MLISLKVVRIAARALGLEHALGDARAQPAHLDPRGGPAGQRVAAAGAAPRSDSATTAGASPILAASCGECSRCRSTSSLVMRPRGPLPVMSAGASLCSASRRRTGRSEAAPASSARRAARAARPGRRRGGAAAAGAAPAPGGALGRRQSAGAAAGLARPARSRPARALVDGGDDVAALDRLALLAQMRAQHAACWGGKLQHDLVGLELGQRLARLDRVAGLLVPRHQRAVGHGFRQLVDFDLDAHRSGPPCELRPLPAPTIAHGVLRVCSSRRRLGSGAGAMPSAKSTSCFCRSRWRW